ncbi:hypothetical protein [Aliarcobacter butzleri]|uniref:Uncharacterized protein n=1 Tax=Aliarcobacter butzleri TaxID=28197 RepID=A0AAW7PTI0_9BACT|nr:hypothetical protein [Aliarcobacter butzleri]MDN5064720.1 hypothetical protein [Aliarcobacter butzleri]MDN5066824.1 hypothetical protein [Aliarcobacter butzleri]
MSEFNINEIKEIITNRKKLTNSFNYYNEVLNWIKNEEAYVVKINNCVFLLLKKNKFCKFYYFIDEYSNMMLANDFLMTYSKNYLISMEITTKDTKNLEIINSFAKELNFDYYSEFARLISGQNNLKDKDKDKDKDNFLLAEKKDIKNLLETMNKEFDPIIDDIPSEEELISLIDNKSIIIKYIEEELIFIQIFEYKFGSLYSRMTWIMKKFRKPKYTIDIYNEIDSYLDYLDINNKNIRAYYWVDVTNKNFLIGQKLGSKPDGLRCITFLYNK